MGLFNSEPADVKALKDSFATMQAIVKHIDQRKKAATNEKELLKKQAAQLLKAKSNNPQAISALNQTKQLLQDASQKEKMLNNIHNQWNIIERKAAVIIKSIPKMKGNASIQQKTAQHATEIIDLARKLQSTSRQVGNEYEKKVVAISIFIRELSAVTTKLQSAAAA